MEKLKINYDAIAQGMFSMMPDDDQMVVCAGMIPQNWLELAAKQFTDKCVRESLVVDLVQAVAVFKRGLADALLKVGGRR